MSMADSDKDAGDFIDAEVIRAKLDKIEQSQERIEGKLEALMAAIEGVSK